jgi:hypothetical protein
MKLTVNQLRRIIKEEVQKVIEAPGLPATKSDWEQTLLGVLGDDYEDSVSDFVDAYVQDM